MDNENLNRSLPSIIISPDAMEARLSIPKGQDASNVTSDEIKELLSQKNVIFGLIDNDKITEYLSHPEKHKNPLVIASGMKSTPTKQDQIKYFIDENPTKIKIQKNVDTKNSPNAKETAFVDFKDRGELQQVKKGDILAEIIRGDYGNSGKNVFGEILAVEKYESVDLKCGKNVIISEDSNQAIATSVGIPRVSYGNFIEVMPELKITGDVNMKTGHVIFEGSVNVYGVVESGFKVKAEHLQANGVMGEVETTGDIIINGGIIGAKIKTQGKLNAKFIKTSTVHAADDINIDREIVDSHVTTGGECFLERGRILASEINAAKGIKAHSIGSQTSPPCRLNIGTDISEQEEMKNITLEVEAKKTLLQEIEPPYVQLQQQIEKFDHNIQEVGAAIKKGMSSKASLEIKLKSTSQNKKVSAAIKDLTEKMKLAKEQVQLFVKQRDKLADQLKAYPKEKIDEILKLKLEIECMENRYSQLSENLKKANKKFSVRVTDTIVRGTIIKGPDTMLVIHDDARNIFIKEAIIPVGNSTEKRMVIRPYVK